MPASSDSRLPTNSHPDADYSMPSVKRANLAAYKARKALYQVVIEGDYELGDQLVEENGNKATGIFGTRCHQPMLGRGLTPPILFVVQYPAG